MKTLLTGEVAQSRVERIVRTCGTDFLLTSTVEERLRRAGAGSGLIGVLKEIQPKKEPVLQPDSPLTTKPSTPAESPVTQHRKPPMLNPALYKAQAPPVFKTKFTTTKGIFVVEVHRDWAPLGADRFYNLVKGGYYDGGPFYRIIGGFMAQFGFSPNPAVSRAWDRAAIKDDPVTQSNKRGFITFAKSGMPNSRSTHLFINYMDNSRLDADGFAPFGTVVLGMEVVDKLFGGYGETDQGKLRDGGSDYVKKALPNLDLIVTAEIMPAGT